jgi:hypothetical protein
MVTLNMSGPSDSPAGGIIGGSIQSSSAGLPQKNVPQFEVFEWESTKHSTRKVKRAGEEEEGGPPLPLKVHPFACFLLCVVIAVKRDYFFLIG